MEHTNCIASFPANEPQRLQRLQLLDVLDTSPEPIFDALTQTASLICNAPIALLSLVDKDRQWFKSNFGLEGTSETEREVAFCAHAILEPKVMVVPDAAVDPRFQDNPLVTGQPNIRFYAGAPIVMAQGERIGTICVIDKKPRELTSTQQEALAKLATAAANALEIRKKALELDRLNSTALQSAHQEYVKEARYHAIVEDQTDLISLALPTGELTFVNEAYAANFGLKPEAMIGRNLLDFVHQNDRETVWNHLQEVCQRPGVAHGENRMQSSSGEERWVAWSNRAVGDAQGKVVELHSVGRDITDRKNFEFALQASQERFRILYESTPAMMHSIDAEGRILYVSDVWLQTLGYQREEVVGQPSIDFLTSDSREFAKKVVLPAFFDSGGCKDVPYQMVKKDRAVIDVLVSATLQRDAHGKPEHTLAVIQDVTEKNAIAKALQVNERRLQLATSANQVGIWEYDLESGRLEWSDNMFAIFGMSKDQFQGHFEDWANRVHPDDMAYANSIFQKAIETCSPMDFDYRIQKSPDEVRFINARAIIVSSTEGRATAVLGTNYDVTERKAVEQALANSEKRLRTIADNLPVLISHIDADFRYLFTNRNYQAWFGLTEPIEGKTVLEVFGDIAYARVKPRILDALSGKNVTFEVEHQTPDSCRHLEVHYVPDKDATGEVQGIFGMVLDKTEQLLAQQRLEAQERLLRTVTDNLPVLISYIDAEEKFRFMNATFKDWLHLDLDSVIGHPLVEVVGERLYGQRREKLQRALKGQRLEFEVESEFDGVVRYLRTTYVPDTRVDGVTYGVFTLSTDITELKKIERELLNLVRVDSLTGLPNRRHFDEKLSEAISRNRRTNSTMALMFLDLDHFKSINDSLGHGAGDQVLCEFASRIRSCLRVTDTAARLAGDEFVVVLEDINSSSEAELVAKKINDAVRLPMSVSALELVVTTSIGIATTYAEDIAPSALIERADKALYRAKDAGRDGFALEGGES